VAHPGAAAAVVHPASLIWVQSSFSILSTVCPNNLPAQDTPGEPVLCHQKAEIAEQAKRQTEGGLRLAQDQQRGVTIRSLALVRTRNLHFFVGAAKTSS